MMRSVVGATVLTAFAVSVASAQSEQSTIGGSSTETPTIVTPTNPNDPTWRVPAGNTRFDGVVRILMNRTDGNFVCSGALLNRTGGFGILSAAHCFTNAAGVSITNSATIELRSAQTGALIASRNVTAANINIKSGYTGAVVDQRDVAYLRMDAALSIGGYNLHEGGTFMGQTIDLAGYGQTGDGGTGAVGGAQTWMRYGQNRFDTSCRNLNTNANNCAGVLGGNPSNNLNGYGGVLLGDFDDPTNAFNNNSSLTCFRHGICDGAVGANEVNIGGGDSGSSAFLASTGDILGVASFGSRRVDLTPVPNFGAFGTAFGYACVANVTFNDVCRENFNFVNSFLEPRVAVPEPGSLALLGVGFAGLLAARRRRAA